MFQSSLNCESSLKFFSAEFSVNFLSVVLIGRILVVNFLLILHYFLGNSIQESSDLTYLQA